MLVLSRRRGEVIRIGDDIVVTALALGGGTVTIRVEAPSNFGGTFEVTRWRDGRIHLGSSIEIMVVRVGGKVVRLGFTAPDDVPILRQELYEAINNRTKKKPRRGRGQC